MINVFATRIEQVTTAPMNNILSFKTETGGRVTVDLTEENWQEIERIVRFRGYDEQGEEEATTPEPERCRSKMRSSINGVLMGCVKVRGHKGNCVFAAVQETAAETA